MNPLTAALAPVYARIAPELLEIYKDLHRHPELSMQEQRTAGIAADYIEKLGYEVTRGVGVTGVVGLLRNGAGPTVMLRADMDALPMAEDTGLPYASTVTATDADGRSVGVAHSCGHGHAPADRGVARGRAPGGRRADHRLAAGRHQGKHHSRRCHHQTQHAHV